MDIPDTNVWLGLIDQNHIHHVAAAKYWHEGTEIAFTPISMMGFFRLSTQPGVLSRALSTAEAWGIYRQFLADSRHAFLAEPKLLEDELQNLTAQTGLPHRLWTDAYLAAFAISGRHRLISFDADFSRFSGLNFLHLSP